jgi:heparan-alpha-glucosaminide N-acetyltransferase
MTYQLNQPDTPGSSSTPSESSAEASEARKSARLVSLDAFRGMVMLAMAASGLAFAKTLRDYPEILNQYKGDAFDQDWRWIWHTLAYQFSHVKWTGCSFWDLIQPSFMFMVGVSMPFSYSRRSMMGQSGPRRFGHVIVRSLVLIFLGVFLSSQRDGFVNFTFVNVLAQIGLGYSFLYLFLGQKFPVQLIGVAAILGGYGYYFSQYEISQADQTQLTEYLDAKVIPGIESDEKLSQEEKEELKKIEFGPFEKNETDVIAGLPAHWNKHTNAAAEVDRKLLNWKGFPRKREDEFNGQKFWVNSGGYQTLNFIPSIATMLFGLMAGQLLRTGRSQKAILKRLLTGGAICFAVAMAADTTIWPYHVEGFDWSLCPAVKRIWTPTWAVFSSGWCFWILGMFYWVIDIKGFQRWAFFLKIVGMNSIAFYCMSQLIKGWGGRMLKIWLTTLEEMVAALFPEFEFSLSYFIYNSDYTYAGIFETIARVFVLWLIALWLYRRKIFIRI